MATKEELVNSFKKEKVTAELALKDESVEVCDISEAVSPDPETDIMDLCRELPSAVALDTSASNIPWLPSMMEVEAADEKLHSVDTSISGDDIFIEKEKNSALSYNRNALEMNELKFNSSIFLSRLEPTSLSESLDSKILFSNSTSVQLFLLFLLGSTYFLLSYTYLLTMLPITMSRKHTTMATDCLTLEMESSYLPWLHTTGLGMPLWPRYTVPGQLCCMPSTSTSMSPTTRLLDPSCSMCGNMWKPPWCPLDNSTMPSVFLINSFTNCMMLRLLTLLLDMEDIKAGTPSPGEHCRSKVRILTLHFPQGLEMNPWPCMADLSSMPRTLCTLVPTSSPCMSDLWKPPWPLYSTSSSVSMLPITSSRLASLPPELRSMSSTCLPSSVTMATKMFSLGLSWLPSSTLMSVVCCSLTCTRSGELTEGLFMWWLLGELPPWARRDFFIQNITNFVMSAPYHLASSVMGAPLLMLPLLSRVEYPFSFLVMPSVETTANQGRHTNISNTWRSGYTSLFMLLFSTILSLISGLYLVTEWWRAHADADAPKEVSVSVEDAGETSDSTVLALSSYYLATMASELMKELSVSPPGDLKEETQRKQTHGGFIYNAEPVSLHCLSSNLASLHMKVPIWSCLSDYTSLFNFIKNIDKGCLCSTDSSVSINYLAWLVTTGLVHIEDITAWKYFPQVINVCSKIRILILHFSQAGLEVPPWPLSRLNFLLSAMICSWIPSSTLMSEVCCRLIRGLFMMPEWWLLGEPPPWASSNNIGQYITNYLVMPFTCLLSSVAGAFMFLLYLCCCTMHRETLLAPNLHLPDYHGVHPQALPVEPHLNVQEEAPLALVLHLLLDVCASHHQLKLLNWVQLPH